MSEENLNQAKQSGISESHVMKTYKNMTWYSATVTWNLVLGLAKARSEPLCTGIIRRRAVMRPSTWWWLPGCGSDWVPYKFFHLRPTNHCSLSTLQVSLHIPGNVLNHHENHASVVCHLTTTNAETLNPFWMTPEDDHEKHAFSHTLCQGVASRSAAFNVEVTPFKAPVGLADNQHRLHCLHQLITSKNPCILIINPRVEENRGNLSSRFFEERNSDWQVQARNSQKFSVSKFCVRCIVLSQWKTRAIR